MPNETALVIAARGAIAALSQPATFPADVALAKNMLARALTPYERHEAQGHSMTRHSPNGVDIVEECDCGARFLHNPAIGYPVTLY